MTTDGFSGSEQNGQRAEHVELPDASPIHRLIRTTRRVLRSAWVAAGLGATVGLLLTAVVAVALADLVLTLWPSMRLVGLLLIVVPVTSAFLMGVVRPLLRRLTDVVIARRIESEISGIHNRLVSCVDLANKDRRPVHSLVFHRRLVQEAISRIRSFRLRSVVDMVSLRRALTFTCVGIVAFLVAFILFSERLPTAMARIFNPFADIPPATGVLFDVLAGEQTEPGDYETLRGADVDFTVVLKKGEVDPPGGPDALRLEVNAVDHDGAPKTLWYEFARLEQDQTAFTLTGMQGSFAYRVHGGGTWSKQYRVTMLDRPRITALQTVLHYPEYMRRPEPLVGAPQTADVTGPQESIVEVLLDVEGDAAEGEIQLLERAVNTADANAAELVVNESFLLSPVDTASDDSATSGPRRWRGTFPLLKDGFYRVELRNRLKYANPEMQAGKLVAIKDNPPEVAIEQPGNDLVLSTPVKVPIYISAFDDFGLDNIELSVQKNESASFQGRPVKKYDVPKRSESTVVTLDLSQEEVKVGDTLKYRVTVEDTHDLRATTRDFTIRLADDNNAADKQLAAFEQKTETLQEKLAELVAEQAKVQDSIEQLAEKFGPLTEKIEQAEDAAAAVAKETPDGAAKPEAAPAPLDPEAAKQLEQVRGELAKSAALEKQAIQIGQQVAAELKQLAEQSPNLQILPPEIAEQFQNAQAAFDEVASKPMQALADMIQKGTQPDQKNPQLPQLEQQGKALEQNLKDLQARVDAVARAEKQSRENVEQALANLRQDLLVQNAGLTARELKELKEFIEAMRGDVKELQGVQEQLLDDNANELSDRMFAKLKEEQKKVDQDAAMEFAEARQLLNSETVDRVRQMPQLAGKLDMPDAGAPDDPPPAKPANGNEPQAAGADGPVAADAKADAKTADTKAADAKPADAKKAKPAKADSKKAAPAAKPVKPPFLPALGGPPPKLDPRVAKKIQELHEAVKAKPDGDKNPAEREALAATQSERLQELNLAEQSLGADQQALEELIASLTPADPAANDPEDAEMLADALPSEKTPAKAVPSETAPADDAAAAKVPAEAAASEKPPLADPPSKSEPAGDPSSAPSELSAEQLDQLAAALRSDELADARAMWQRMQQMTSQSNDTPPNQTQKAPIPTPSESTLSNLDPAADGVKLILVELDDLDVDTRAMIMKMQPKVREELLQGLREEGPEGYRKFIRDYFRRLTKVQGASSKQGAKK